MDDRAPTTASELPPSAPRGAGAPATAGVRAARWIAGGVMLLGVAGGAWYALRQPGDPEALWRQAQTDLQAGRIDRAAEAAATLATLRAPNDHDWMLRAQIAMARDRADEALEALSTIPDASPLAALARRRAGQVELRRNRVRFAEQYFLEALRLDPGEDQARRELVFIYGMQLRRQELADVFREMSRRVVLTADDAFLWSLTRSSVWEAEEQSQTLRKFIEADPDDRWSRLALADSYQTLGRLDAMEEVLAPLPADDPEARTRWAWLAIERGDLAAAERLLADGPDDHAGTARLRGLLALRRRDAEAAIRHFRAAEALDPDDRETLFGLARAYSLAGDAEAAKPYLEAARRLDALATLIQYAASGEGRTDETLPMKLGQACAEAGRTDEARTWYRIAVARDPLNREAQLALYQLEQEAEETGPRGRN